MNGAPSNRSVLICGIPVDDVTLDETVERIDELVDDGRARGVVHQVATVNADFIVGSRDDTRVARILRTTSLSIPDGMAVVWGSRLLGPGLRTRVTGADLIPALIERSSAGTDRTIALIGAAPGIAEQAAARMRGQFPGARIVSDPGPNFTNVDDVDPADVERIAGIDADIGCIAMGNPKQEQFIDRFGAELGFPVMIGIGGTLDFIAGMKRRAPSWMQVAGLEWFFRTLVEPRRLVRRYLRDAVVFLPAVASQSWSGRSTRGEACTVSASGERIVVTIPPHGHVDNAALHRICSLMRTDATVHSTVVIDDRRGLPLPEHLRDYLHDLDERPDPLAPLSGR